MTKRKPYGLSWGERLEILWERIRLCEIQRKHHEKMGSHGRCYRCNRPSDT